MQLGVLYSVYSFPNIVIVFTAGLLVDRIGVNFVCLVCISCVIVGNLITIGNSYWFVLVGRIIYGLGAESMAVVQSSLVARWFSFDDSIALAFASACSLMSFRFNPFLSMFAFPALAEATSLQTVILVVNGIVWVSGTACVLLVILDKIYEKYLHLHDHAKPTVKQSRLQTLTNCIRLPPLYWIATALSVCFYGSILSYISYANRLIETKFGFSPSMSSMVNSVTYGTALLLMVPCGIFVDRIGHRLSFGCFGLSCAIVGYALLAFSTVTPWVPVVLISISFAVVPSVVMPLFALIVDETKLGIAYGLKMSLQNIFQSIIPIIASAIPQYEYKLMLNFGLMVISLILLIILLIIDLTVMHGKIEFTRVKASIKNRPCCFRFQKQPECDTMPHDANKEEAPKAAT